VGPWFKEEKMQNDWYRSFFHGVWLDVWRGVMSPEMTEADASFLETALRLEPGGLVLDVACGAGRHSLALARRGYAPTGIDLSEQSISEARGAAAASGLGAEFLLGDMRELPGPARFDGAFASTQWPKSAASAKRWAWKPYRSTDRSMAGRTGSVPRA
jgi:2-polyprenyl-3-methyl-5-hydroxy-6-metoxy-1,4-benzoquinol methylase